MTKIIVAGNGTGVGKTVVSAILAQSLQADYWKPIETGSLQDSDTQTVKTLLAHSTCQVHAPCYRFQTPVSPHYAAQLENQRIDPDSIKIPTYSKCLVIETVGGVFVPLNDQTLAIDLFNKWDAQWILVSSHYLGSINHTLLTIEALKRRNISIAGIIFNGTAQKGVKEAILHFSNLKELGHLDQEASIYPTIIQKYGALWSSILCQLLL